MSEAVTAVIICRQMSLYRKIPLKYMSRLWGQFNQLVLPNWLRRPALRLYIWMFGCCLEDAAVQDLTKYRNLSEFFRRNLRPGIRPIDSAQILVSVSDNHRAVPRTSNLSGLFAVSKRAEQATSSRPPLNCVLPVL